MALDSARVPVLIGFPYFDGRGLQLGIADLVDSKEFSAVIGGASGSGKSQMSLMILLSAMLNTSPDLLSVIICDPKNKDFLS